MTEITVSLISGVIISYFVNDYVRGDNKRYWTLVIPMVIVWSVLTHITVHIIRSFL